MVFLEAAALGVPSVAGAGGGVASVVDNGRTGRVVVPGNAEAMAGAIAELLDDRSAQAAMGRAAASRVARRHDLPVASARLAEILARSGVTPR